MTRLPLKTATPILTRIFALSLALSPAVGHGATSLQIGITPPTAENGFKRTAYLTWNAQAGCVYTVQSSTTLADPAQWVAEDSVIATAPTAQWMAPEPIADRKFYRLLLPQPWISAVEPAVVAPGAAVDFYITGQCFDTNSVLRINGVVQGNVVFTNSGLISTSFTPDVAGTYLFELVAGGEVVSSFTVTCADVLVNPELVLQGPPESPPAAPCFKEFKELLAKIDRPISKKTAMSSVPRTTGGGDSDEAGEDDNDIFAATASAGTRVRKGMQDIKNLSQNFQIQEGKKGLNAVNVKLARMAAPASQTALSATGEAEYEKWEGIADAGSSGQEEVLTASGEVRVNAVDMAITGRGLDFIWARTYHSRLGRFDANSNGWTFSYDVRCAQNSSGGMDLYDGTGRKDTFKLQGNGVYTCPEFFREGTISSNVFRLTFADSGYWEFLPFGGTPTAGKLHRIVDRNGNTMTLGYDGSGHLTQIEDDLGRINTIAHDAAGRIVSVTDFSGRTVTYQYYTGLPSDPGGGPGDLKSVTSPSVTGTPNGNDFPNGKTIGYSYTSGSTKDAENHLLLSTRDALGQTTAKFTYAIEQAATAPYEPVSASAWKKVYLKCTSAQRGEDTPTIFIYVPQEANSASGYATMRCIINDPVGNVTECFYDARNRRVMERQFTGRATPGELVTDTANRPANKLRPGDPDSFETRWSWNNDSLCTKATAPGGGQLQYVYQSDYNKATPARKRGDCRMLREIASSAVDLDGDGAEDTSERVSRYEYDPRFGSDPTPGYGKKIFVGNLPFSDVAKGQIKGTDPGHGSSCGENGISLVLMKLMEQSSQSQKSIEAKAEMSQFFVTSATDPRGTVTTTDYDANGNRVKVKFPQMPGAEVDFSYNAFGQWTSVTHAADGNGYRRVDTCSYYNNGPQMGMVEVMIASALTGGLSLTTAFEHDTRGNVTRWVDSLGRDRLFTYNALDQCVRAESPVNLTERCATDFSYDANDNLVQCSVELRDADDTKVGDVITALAYDMKNRLISVTVPVSSSINAVTGFTYDDNDQVTEIRSPLAMSGSDLHNIETRFYDERGLLFQEIEAPASPLQCTSQVDYDANGNPTRVSVGLEGTPSITTMEYDGFSGFDSDGMNLVAVKSKGTLFRLSSCASTKSGGKELVKHLGLVNLSSSGRCSRVTDPMGNVTTFHYDANDNLKVERHSGETNDVLGSAGNIRLAESRFDYDALDLCVTRHDLHFNPATQVSEGDGEATTHIVRSPNGECAGIIDDLGHMTDFGHDTAGRLTSISSDGAKSVAVRFRDAAGNVTSMTRTDTPDLGGPPQVFTITNAFDSRNRCVSSTDNVGNTSSRAFDSLDRVVRETDENGNDTTYTYDSLGNCLGSTRYSGSSSDATAIVVRASQAAYDINSRRISSIDANGNSTSYAYDSLDNLVTTTRADGTHLSLVWSPRSNLIQETDANGTITTNSFDPGDRLIHRDIAVHGPAMATTTFETFSYDGASQLAQATNDVSSLAFTHDSLGNAVSTTQDGLTTASTFDATGNRLAMTYPSGRVVSYTYNSLDCVTNVATSQNGISFPSLTSIGYAGERVVSVNRPNGINTLCDWDGVASPVNPPGDFGWQQLNRVRHGTAQSPSLLADVAATYSHTQSKSSQVDAVSGRGRVLGYDALDQLVSSSVMMSGLPPQETIYILDANGNRQQVTTAGVPADYTMDNTIPPGDSQMNRYTNTPFGAQTYDANGNLLQRTSTAGQTLYHYDYANRLVGVDIMAGQLTAVSYRYDALGRRISNVSEAKPMAPRESKFLFDGGSVIEVRVDDVLSEIFVHVSGLKEEIRENDNMLGRIASFTPAGEVRYYHCDELGNTLALTDGGGNVLERYAYGDYGAVTFLTSGGTPTGATISSVGNAYCWGGLRLDAETGLHNDDGGNYFDPQSGRAITRAVPRNLQGIRLRCGSQSGFPGNNPWSGGSPSAMKNGTVKFFNVSKGFGFLKADERIWPKAGYWSASESPFKINPGDLKGDTPSGEPSNANNDVNR